MSETNNIIVTIKNKVQVIVLNRPKAKNALNKMMYTSLTKLLNDSAVNDDIVASVITGNGDFYSSGNDIKGVSDYTSDDPILEGRTVLQKFVEAFITYPKILVAVLNGPAIGIAATTMALFDLVYASEKAFIQTPFTKLALCPEGCSTYTYPKLFGPSRANELLVFGRKLSMEEARNCGFVSETFSSEDQLNKIWDKIYSLGDMPKTSLMLSKTLPRNFDVDALILANIKECNALEERWQSDDFIQAISDFAGKSKL